MICQQLFLSVRVKVSDITLKIVKCLRSPVSLSGAMITGNTNCRPKDSERNSFLAFILLLSIFFTAATSEESITSLQEVLKTGRNIEQSDVSLNNNMTLNETDSKTNGLIISIPSIVILTMFIIFLSYVLRRKQNCQISSSKPYTSGRLMQLYLGQQNSSKEAESVKFTKSNLDTETSVDEVKPLRNMSEESELSRSVMASASSEKENENGFQRKKSLIKKGRHY
ncbi:unnamed protein product [Brugia pahangi]|uniref:PIR Superfamily Protein n=1 Tax=Brugia pahangi TaxID=6280 RepID=A0A0N4TTC6_BRUPA|nr:unnamed protein product [Brugia pahangi]